MDIVVVTLVVSGRDEVWLGLSGCSVFSVSLGRLSTVSLFVLVSN